MLYNNCQALQDWIAFKNIQWIICWILQHAVLPKSEKNHPLESSFVKKYYEGKLWLVSMATSIITYISIRCDQHFKWPRVRPQYTDSHLWHIVCHIIEVVSDTDCDIQICCYKILNKLNWKQILYLECSAVSRTLKLENTTVKNCIFLSAFLFSIGNIQFLMIQLPTIMTCAKRKVL